MKLKKMCTMHKAWLSAIFVLLTSASFSQGGAAVNTTGAAADPSSIFDASSNSQGILIPRMTTAERNNISNPALGLQIFNTDCENIDIYVSSGWKALNQSSLTPAAPVAGTNVPYEKQIIWNWNTVAGAAGYKYNTVNDYLTSVDNGTSTSYVQMSLTCGTTYLLYVWAYNTCGNSQPAILLQATSACITCGVSNVTFNYKGSSVTYGTVNGQNSTCWLDRNLGAGAIAASYNHYAAYGDLFQWGRLDDGHQARGSSTSLTLSNTDIPGHSDFILAPGGSPYDWRNGQNNNLWQGSMGTNNPCPANWRIPTATELNNERLSWSSNNYNGAISSSLKMPASGYRDSNNGNIYGEGGYGGYWSSTVDGVYARYLYFHSSDAFTDPSTRASGFVVRCIKD